MLKITQNLFCKIHANDVQISAVHDKMSAVGTIA